MSLKEALPKVAQGRAPRKWLKNLLTTLLVAATISGPILATKFANEGIDIVDKRAATRHACTEFVVGRASLSNSAADAMRVLQNAKALDAATVAEVQEKRRTFEAAHAIYLRAIAELLFIADVPLKNAAGNYHTKLEAAVKATFAYYAAVQIALTSGQRPGAPPTAEWDQANAAAVAVEDACRAQATSGSFNFW